MLQYRSHPCPKPRLDEQGTLPGTKAAFLGSSLATILGGLLGTSPTIIHNETCAGIADGGRTGLTALVVALMFCASVFFVPTTLTTSGTVAFAE